jgi:hypothetical protein
MSVVAVVCCNRWVLWVDGCGKIIPRSQLAHEISSQSTGEPIRLAARLQTRAAATLGG